MVETRKDRQERSRTDDISDATTCFMWKSMLLISFFNVDTLPR